MRDKADLRVLTLMVVISLILAALLVRDWLDSH